MCMRHYGDSFASKLAPTPDSGFVREQARSHTGFGIRSRASSLPHRIRDSFASKLAPTPSKLAPTPDSFASKLAPTPRKLAPTPRKLAPTPCKLAPTPFYPPQFRVR